MGRFKAGEEQVKEQKGQLKVKVLEWFASVLSEGAGPQQPPTCGVWWCGRGNTAHIQEGHAPGAYGDGALGAG